jgi:hypothetical protein
MICDAAAPRTIKSAPHVIVSSALATSAETSAADLSLRHCSRTTDPALAVMPQVPDSVSPDHRWRDSDVMAQFAAKLAWRSARPFKKCSVPGQVDCAATANALRADTRRRMKTTPLPLLRLILADASSIPAGCDMDAVAEELSMTQPIRYRGYHMTTLPDLKLPKNLPRDWTLILRRYACVDSRMQRNTTTVHR